MKVLKSVRLHNSLVLSGTTLTSSNYTIPHTAKTHDVKLLKNEENGEVYVMFGSEFKVVGPTNVADYEYEDSSDLQDLFAAHFKPQKQAKQPVAKAQPMKKTIDAQVSSPQSHVFGGLGAGNTGLGANIK